MVRKQARALTGALGIGLLTTGGAVAVDAEFCKSGTSCVDGLIKNRALITVQRTHINQEEKHGCAKVEKTIEKDLYKGTTEIHLKFSSDCRYKIKFATTSGCTGDKEGQLSRSDVEDHITEAYLDGGCGTLKVKKTKYKQKEDE